MRKTAARLCCRRSAAPLTSTLAFVLVLTLALVLTLTRSHAHPHSQSWVGGGEAIIVLGVDSAEQMKSLLSEAAQKGLCTHCVADAGRTEVAPGTETAGCIGPAPVQSIDVVTGHLGLM